MLYKYLGITPDFVIFGSTCIFVSSFSMSSDNSSEKFYQPRSMPSCNIELHIEYLHKAPLQKAFLRLSNIHQPQLSNVYLPLAACRLPVWFLDLFHNCQNTARINIFCDDFHISAKLNNFVFYIHQTFVYCIFFFLFLIYTLFRSS